MDRRDVLWKEENEWLKKIMDYKVDTVYNLCANQRKPCEFLD